MSDFEPITIEIEASASKANTELDKVDQALGRIQSSIGEISKMLNGISGKGSSLSSSMRTLASAINSINPNNAKEVSRAIDNMAQSSDKAERKVRNISSSIDGLNSKLSKTSQASSSFEKMLPALVQVNDYMSAFNSWVDRCFNRDMGIDTFSRQLREIPRIMQEITTARNNALAIQFREAIPLIEQATDGVITFERYIKDCFNQDIGADFFSSQLREIPQLMQEITAPRNNSIAEQFRETIPLIEQATDKMVDFDRYVEDCLNIDLGRTNVNTVFDKISETGKGAIKGLVDSTIEEMSNLPAVIERGYMDMFERLERVKDSSKFNFDASWRDLGTEKINNAPFEMPKDVIPTWKEALEQVRSFENEYSKLSGVMGEADAEMQTAVNIVNTLNRAFSMTKTGQMSWDTSRMKEASAILSEMQDKIDRVNASFKNQNLLEGNATPELETWKTVFEDIEAINNSFNGLSQKIGEANAEMSNLVDVRNRLNKAFSDTESGKLPWDNESMQRAYRMLDEVNDKINRVKTNLKDPDKLEINVDPTGELEKLYARLKEVQSLISDMRNNKINFSTEDMTSALKEQESITKRIAELEGRGKSKETGTLPWMAQVIALQHELEKMSGMFDRWGEVAKKAFLKALTPLKLFKHEFEEIKGLITSVSRIGSAFAMISKPITKVFKNFQKSVQQAFSKIQKAWAKVMRTFTFMLIRKAITAILTNINNAITSLAKFSKTVDGKFNDTMSLLTSDFRYLGASLVAAFAPILNYVMPIIDRLVDSLVGVINKVNMFFAVLTKSKTYTIAKKKIVDYTDAMEDANKKAKQLTLGIDELNILSEDTATKKDEEDMFDWVTLPTPEIDIPDWLKWLKGLWDKLWQAIKKMLKALWDAIKDAWNRAKDYLINAIKHFLESLVGLITDIIRDLTRLFNTEKFRAFLAKLMRIVAKIIEFIAIIIDKIREAWNYNELGYHILEAILDILDTIATHVENILDLMIEWAQSLTFVPLFEAILAVLKQINYAVDQIGYVAEDVAKIVLGILKLVIEDYAPRLLRVIGDIIEGIGNIAKKLHEAIEDTDFVDRFVESFDGIMQAIIPHIEEVGKYFKQWALEIDFTPLLNSIIKLMNSLKPVGDFIGGVFEDIVKLYVLPMAKHIVEEVIPMIANAISNFADAVDWGKLRAGLAKVIEAFEHLQGSIGEGVADAIDRIGQAVANFINSNEFQKFLENLANFMSRISPELVSNVLTGIGLAILRIAKALVKFVNSEPFQRFLNALINFLTYSDANKIASILLNIAKAIVAFKFLAFVGEGLANFLTFIALIGKAVQGLQSLSGVLSAVGGAIKALSGVGAVFGGLVLAIKEFVDMWVNGWSAIKTILEALGLALAAVGAVLLGAPALIAGVIAGIVFAVSQLAILLHQHWDDIKNWFSSAWDNFKTWAISTWESITGGVAGVWTGFIEKVRGIWETVKGFFASVWESFKGWAIGIWNSIIDAVAGAWNTFLEKIQGVWQTILDWFNQIWGDFKIWVFETWSSITQAVVDAWNGLIEKIQAVWDEIKLWFEETWNTFTEWVGEVWNGIVQVVVDVWNGISEKLQEAWNGVQDWFDETWEDFKSWCSEKWDSIVNTIADTWGKLKDFAIEKWEEIKEAISIKWDEIKQGAVDKWEEIKQAIHDKWEELKQDAQELLGKLAEEIHDLWNDIKDWWDEVWTNINNIVSDWWNSIVETAHSIFDGINDFFTILWDGIQDCWDSVWGAIKDVISGWWENIREDAKTGWDEAVDVVTSLWNNIEEWWSKVWDSIYTTITGKWTDFKRDVVEWWDDIADHVKNVWDGVAETWHKIWEGLSDFIKGIVNGVLGWFGGLINGVVDGVNTIIDMLNNLSIDIPDNPLTGAFTLGFSLSHLNHLNIPTFATGGMPEDGWFRASHGEIMGRFDNGQSVVANNEQITDGIARAVSSSLVPILNDIAQSSRETADKDMVLRVDSREIAKANSKGQSKLGRSLISFD